ncbi:hypothetical protein HELRODRAFT_161220 [Helobdella robusta]|uniref:Outer dense fiber protein 3 n=1 Tax=Helobdella robusta TaxID=6412 RepID=T1ER82_HELRO|nr:hypothetical protein HELRODRAFT_161220 [Helobdella robusta]ESO02001.1 hypothetical protein HELRODRAFT_161220 [Helobdella robusta]
MQEYAVTISVIKIIRVMMEIGSLCWVSGSMNLLNMLFKRLKFMSQSPGPAYKLRSLVGHTDHCVTKQKNPAYTIGTGYKFVLIGSCTDIPGPSYNFKSELTNTGLQLPRTALILGRPKTKEVLPGPGQYEPKLLKSLSSISLGNRSKSSPNLNPPPNAYTINDGIGKKCPVQGTPPAMLIRSRTEFGSIYYPSTKAAVPGPGSYKQVEMKKDVPIVIKNRCKVKDYNTALNNPAPGSYNLPSFVDKPKGFHMGIRHSSCVMPTYSHE